VPQAIPGVSRGACFAGVGEPSRGGLREGLGRADQVAFVARGAATLFFWRGRHLIEHGTDRKTADNMARIGKRTPRVLGCRAAVGQTPDGTLGQLRGRTIEAVAGALTAGALRHPQLWGLGRLARACQTHGHPEAVARPPREGHAPEAPHKIYAVQRTVGLSG